MSANRSPIISYMPLERFNVVPLTTLEPDAIKAAVKVVLRNPDDPAKHTTLLNAVVKGLGFKGGFPDYLVRWPEVERFMRAQDMRERVDFAHGHGGRRVHLFRQRISDRLFRSGRSRPERIFVGRGVDWDAFDPFDLKVRTPPPSTPVGAELAAAAARTGIEVDQFLYGHNWDLGRRFAGDSLILQALLVGPECDSTLCTLLHDGLVQPRGSAEVVVKLYWENTADQMERERTLRQKRQAMHLFQEHIDASRAGWGEVIPLPGSDLVFVRTPDGAWDFFFPQMRDSAPPHYPFHDHLSREDVPNAFVVGDQFKTWLYFRRDGWPEQDEHVAESHFYKMGGDRNVYPASGVERAYHEAVGNYRPVPVAGRREPLSGFRRVAVQGGRVLHVSDLVTIDAYWTFLHDTNYDDRRVEQNDRLEPPNRDPGHLPVTVSYYDALAYCSWLERKTGRPLRLLRTDEYRQLHPGVRPNLTPDTRADAGWLAWVYDQGCIEIIGKGGQVASNFGWVEDDQTVRFKHDLAWGNGPSGVRFLMSITFGEWLYEHADRDAAAINTSDLMSVHDGDAVERDFFPAEKWGKYRCCKIGFRLCYDAESDVGR